MKKNAVNSIFADEYKRRNRIILYVCGIIIFLILFVSFACTYLAKNKKDYVSYTEDSDVNYKVYLKENDFFEKAYAEEKKQYIASLIDYISANFKYDINVDKDNVDFKYLYYIDAEVNVKERTGTNSLYDFTETILSSKNGTSHGKSNVSIKENVKIDYNHYNDLIKEFVKTYNLDDIVSTLTINLHIETISSCSDFNSDETIKSVVSLVIPLTTKTMAIDITDNLIGNNDKFILCGTSSFTLFYLIASLVSFASLLVLSIQLSLYVSKTRTAKDKYERELKKILSNYHPFIQKVDNYFDLSEYKLVAIDTFIDMLEIRDTVNQPILMVESKEKNGVHFIIPSNTKILYTYSLRIEDQKEEK